MYVLYITNGYDNNTINNFTDNENNIDISIPTILLSKPSGKSI